MAAIDLGELHGDDEAPRQPDQIPRRVLRQLGLVGMFALCLTMLAASLPKAEPLAVATIPARPDAVASVQDGLLLIVDERIRQQGIGVAGVPHKAGVAPTYRSMAPTPALCALRTVIYQPAGSMATGIRATSYR